MPGHYLYKDLWQWCKKTSISQCERRACCVLWCATVNSIFISSHSWKPLKSTFSNCKLMGQNFCHGWSVWQICIGGGKPSGTSFTSLGAAANVREHRPAWVESDVKASHQPSNQCFRLFTNSLKWHQAFPLISEDSPADFNGQRGHLQRRSSHPRQTNTAGHSCCWWKCVWAQFDICFVSGKWSRMYFWPYTRCMNVERGPRYTQSICLNV